MIDGRPRFAQCSKNQGNNKRLQLRSFMPSAPSAGRSAFRRGTSDLIVRKVLLARVAPAALVLLLGRAFARARSSAARGAFALLLCLLYTLC